MYIYVLYKSILYYTIIEILKYIFFLAHRNDSQGYSNPSAMTVQKWVRRRLESGSGK